MNRCQFCGAPSTIHLTDIQNNTKRQMHLCERCGQEHELIPAAPSPQLNLPALLQLLLGEMTQATATASATAPDHGSLTCPACGLKYGQFRTAGRFGCPDDYETFREPLMPLLERIHRGLDHAGKAPRRRRLEAEMTELNEQLAAAIAAEHYETAARIRDEMRRKDTANG
jgi:protein arginine kinase activator